MAADRETVLNLRAVAVLAEKLALDVENGKLWEGDYETRLQEIRRNLDEVSRRSNSYWGR